MNPRLVVLVLVALFSAGTAMFVAKGWLASQRAPAPVLTEKAPARPQFEVLVAAKNLPAGHLVQANDLRWQAWPDAALADPYLLKTQHKIDDIVGSVVRTGFAAGEPIVQGRVVEPGDRGFVAAVLAPGMRAVTVAVNTTTGIAGFVFPGDRVDLILTLSTGGGKDKGRRAAETVLANVRVLGIDQMISDQSDAQAKPAKVVTLEVTPKQVEMVALMTDIGRLSLSLRSLQPPVGDDPTMRRLAALADRVAPHTWDSEVSRLIRKPTIVGRSVIVNRGGEESVVIFGSAAE